MKAGDSNKLTILATMQRVFGAENVVKEHKFHPVRRWRFDYAVPEIKLAVEYDGVSNYGHAGRHSSLVGMTGDNEKFNTANLMGWTVLRFTKMNFGGKKTKGISTAVEMIERAKVLKERTKQ